LNGADLCEREHARPDATPAEPTPNQPQGEIDRRFKKKVDETGAASNIRDPNADGSNADCLGR
jgi:hypothetical protein